MMSLEWLWRKRRKFCEGKHRLVLGDVTDFCNEANNFNRYFCRPTGFILDVITTFPFYIISYGFGGLRNAEVAADIRGLQLFRVVWFADLNVKWPDSDLLSFSPQVSVCTVSERNRDGVTNEVVSSENSKGNDFAGVHLPLLRLCLVPGCLWWYDVQERLLDEPFAQKPDWKKK